MSLRVFMYFKILSSFTHPMIKFNKSFKRNLHLYQVIDLCYLFVKARKTWRGCKNFYNSLKFKESCFHIFLINFPAVDFSKTKRKDLSSHKTARFIFFNPLGSLWISRLFYRSINFTQKLLTMNVINSIGLKILNCKYLRKFIFHTKLELWNLYN